MKWRSYDPYPEYARNFEEDNLLLIEMFEPEPYDELEVEWDEKADQRKLAAFKRSYPGVFSSRSALHVSCKKVAEVQDLLSMRAYARKP